MNKSIFASLDESNARRREIETRQTSEPVHEHTVIQISLIDREGNPRKKSGLNADSIRSFAANIDAVGLLSPIIVRKNGKRYQLIGGERRIRAFEYLKRAEIPAIIIDRDHYDEAQETTARLVENLQRSDLTSGEYAVSIGELLILAGSQKEVCRLTGLSKAQVSDYSAHAEYIREVPDAVMLATSTVIEIMRAPEEVRSGMLRAALAGEKRAEVRSVRSSAGRTPVRGVKDSGRPEFLRARRALESAEKAVAKVELSAAEKKDLRKLLKRLSEVIA